MRGKIHITFKPKPVKPKPVRMEMEPHPLDAKVANFAIMAVKELGECGITSVTPEQFLDIAKHHRYYLGEIYRECAWPPDAYDSADGFLMDSCVRELVSGLIAKHFTDRQWPIYKDSQEVKDDFFEKMFAHFPEMRAVWK